MCVFFELCPFTIWQVRDWLVPKQNHGLLVLLACHCLISKSLALAHRFSADFVSRYASGVAAICMFDKPDPDRLVSTDVVL